MNVPLPPQESFMRHDIRDRWARHWIAAIVMLAAIIGLGILSTSVLRAYSQSHYEYLTRVSAPSPQVGLA
jgi:NADH:ubiquinone oxidoreductase subunit 4 (subunit M)